MPLAVLCGSRYTGGGCRSRFLDGMVSTVSTNLVFLGIAEKGGSCSCVGVAFGVKIACALPSRNAGKLGAGGLLIIASEQRPLALASGAFWGIITHTARFQ